MYIADEFLMMCILWMMISKANAYVFLMQVIFTVGKLTASL